MDDHQAATFLGGDWAHLLARTSIILTNVITNAQAPFHEERHFQEKQVLPGSELFPCFSLSRFEGAGRIASTPPLRRD